MISRRAPKGVLHIGFSSLLMGETLGDIVRRRLEEYETVNGHPPVHIVFDGWRGRLYGCEVVFE